MDDFTEALGRAIRYSRERLPVSAIHPELRFTRLGAVLREHATEPSEVGELAYQALTSPHDQPLELMPLHLLRDKMQEEPDHPLAGKFNWKTVPDRVELDRHLHDWLKGVVSGPFVMRSIVYRPDSDFHGSNHHVDQAVNAVSTRSGQVPTRQQIKDSANRLLRRFNLFNMGQEASEQELAELADPEQAVNSAETYR